VHPEVEQAAVQPHVREGLPEPERTESEARDHREELVEGKLLSEQDLDDEDREVRDQQLLDDRGCVGRAERDPAAPVSSSVQAASPPRATIGARPSGARGGCASSESPAGGARHPRTTNQATHSNPACQRRYFSGAKAWSSSRVGPAGKPERSRTGRAMRSPRA